MYSMFHLCSFKFLDILFYRILAKDNLFSFNQVVAVQLLPSIWIEALQYPFYIILSITKLFSYK